MKICPNCGKQHDDSVMFCNACGTKIEVPAAPQQPTKFCNVCGKQLPANAGFCDGCGNRFGAPVQKQGAGITPAMLQLFKFISGAACKASIFFAALAILFLEFAYNGRGVGIAVQPFAAIMALLTGLAAIGFDVVIFLYDKKSDIFTRISKLIPSGLTALFGLLLLFNM